MKYNKSRAYLLPLISEFVEIEIVFMSYLKNTYLFGIDNNNNGCIGLLYDFSAKYPKFNTYEHKLIANELYVKSYPVGNQIMYVFNFPEEYLPEYNSLYQGKYSEFGIDAKEMILKFWAMRGHSKKEMLDFLIEIKQVLYKDEKLRLKLEKDLNIKFVWNLIAKSIRIIPIDYTISSIGSQGFLSIPLYKKDNSLDTFDFIRLHIWDDSLDKLIDVEKMENFSIHSHTFFAKSWIITGKIINDRYDFTTNSDDGEHSFFEVVYNNSLNQVNQHSSKAVNKNINTKLNQNYHY